MKKFSITKLTYNSHKNLLKKQEYSERENSEIFIFYRDFLLNLVTERLDYNKKVIVIGNEANGVSKEILEFFETREAVLLREKEIVTIAKQITNDLKHFAVH